MIHGFVVMWLSVQYGWVGRYGGHLLSVYSTWFPCHIRALLGDCHNH